MSRFLLLLVLLLTSALLHAQSTDCDDPTPFCTDSGANYPAGVGTGFAPLGNNYGCLRSRPNPAWFYLEIDDAGAINIDIAGSGNRDIDFALWGPYPSITAATNDCGSLPAPIDCSFSPSSTETINIPNSSPGQVYIVLITNFSRQNTTVTASQTSGAGSTNCCFAVDSDLNDPPLVICDPQSINPNSIAATFPNGDNPQGYCYNYLIFNTSGNFITSVDQISLNNGAILGGIFNGQGPGDYTICGISYAPDPITSGCGFPTALTNLLFTGATATQINNLINNPIAPICAVLSSTCQTVTLGGSTTIDLGPNVKVCDDTYSLDAGVTDPGTWTATGGPGTATFANPSSPTTQVTVSDYGTYTFTYSITTAGCTSSDDVDITFVEPLVATLTTTCDPVTGTYVVEIVLSSGDVGTSVFGGAATGTFTNLNPITWTSDPISADQNYNIDVTHVDPDCASLFFSGGAPAGCTVIPPCSADGGTINPSPFTPCAGDPSLDLNMSVTFSGGSPPGPDYGYVYTINIGGIIQSYSMDPDLSSLTPGTYEICGLSYLLADAAALPAIIGQDINTLQTDLQSSSPPFCGDRSAVCSVITINAAPTSTDLGVIDICANTCFTAPDGTPFCTDGDYSVIIPDANGCPDTTFFTINTLPDPTPFVLDTTICDNSVFVWFGNGFTPGSYPLIIPTADGCDSSVTINVNSFTPIPPTILPPVDVCEGQSFLGPDGNTYSSSTNQSITVPSAVTGCDSMVQFSVNFTPPPQGNVDRLVCTGETILFDGMTYGAGLYPIQTTTTAGCDSIINLRVSERPILPTVNLPPVTICEGTSYTAPDGNSYSTAQTISFTTPSAVTGCDSITQIALTVTPPPVFNIDSLVCPGGSIVYNGSTFFAGSTTVNLTSPAGCDSIVQVNVTERPPLPITNLPPANICQGQCFRAPDGLDYCNPGTFTIPFASVNGCDSIIQFTVSLVTPPPVPFDTLVCPGECIIYEGSSICAPGSFPFTLTGFNGCDSNVIINMLEEVVIALITPNPPPIVNCDRQFVTLNGSGSVPAGGTYDWSGPNTGTNTATVDVSDPGTYTLTYTVTSSSGGTCSATSSVNIINNAAPPITPIITGPLTVCQGELATYSINPDPNTDTYTWTIPADATLVTGTLTGNSISINWGNSAGGQICVTAENGCEALPPVCIDVIVSPTPALAVPTGPTDLCAGDAASYSVPNDPNTDTYNWTIIGQGTITAGQGTNQVDVNWRAPGGRICVSAVNNCGATPPQCIDVAVGAFPTTPVMIGDFSIVCTTENSIYAAPTVPTQGITDITWNLDPANCGTIISGQGTEFIEVDWDDDCAGDFVFVSVTFTNDCGSATADDFVELATPPTIDAGADDTTCGTTYPLAASGVTTGRWTTVSGPGVATFSNNATPTTTVSISTPGVYTFQFTGGPNGCNANDQVTITFAEGPSLAGSVQEACAADNSTYTVTFDLQGGTAPYTLSSGDPGTFVGTTFTSAALASGTPYSFSFVDANGCGPLVVSGNRLCGCQTSAGTMDLTPLLFCNLTDLAQAVWNNNGNLDSNDISLYVLHTGSGTSLGTVLNENTTGSFGFDAATMTAGTTYYISYVAGNDDNGTIDLTDNCLSVAQGQPVRWNQQPTAAAGDDQSVCDLTTDMAAVLSIASSSGTWTQTSGPTTATFANSNDPTSMVSVNAAGTYVFTWTESNAGCTDTDEVTITFGDPVVVVDLLETCDNTGSFYTVTFDLLGTTVPDAITGTPGTLSGSTFTSDPIAAGGSYSFTIELTSSPCPDFSLSGSFACNCLTEGGFIIGAPQNLCDNATNATPTVSDTLLDANDLLLYYLHDNAGMSLGTVFATNTTGVFGFDPAIMDYGTTYYVSSVVGSNDGSGTIDLNDPCLGVAQGIPVTWSQTPNADAGTDQTVCALTTTLAATATPNSTGRWQIITGTGSGFGDQTLSNATFTANTSGTYVLTWTETNGNCSDTDTMSITFLDALVLSNVAETCNALGTEYTVTFDISGGATPYSVTGLAGTLSGNTFTSDPIGSGLTYSLTVTDASICAETTLDGAFACDCLSDAGTLFGTPFDLCLGDSTNLQIPVDTILDPNDLGVFVLHTTNSTALGTVLAESSTGVFGFDATIMTFGTTYFISYVVGNDNGNSGVDLNDPCLSVSQTVAVTWQETPVADAGLDQTICNLIATLAASGTNGQWAVSAGTGGTFSDPTSPSTTFTVTGAGTYVLTWTETNGNCSDTDTVSITFLDALVLSNVAETCNALGTEYTVTFDISGGATPYSVTGLAGTLSGNTFTSDPIGTGLTYSLTVTDASICAETTLDGAFACDCLSDAGTLFGTPFDLCLGDSTNLQIPVDTILDPNDLGVFVLHTTNSTALGTVLAESSTGVFGFDATIMTFGTTYFISYLVGNDNGNSGVDLNDPCLSVTIGVPVVFNQTPIVSAGSDETFCEQTFNVVSSVDPVSSTVTWSSNGGASFTDANASSTTATLSTIGSTDLFLTADNNGCFASDTVNITTTAPIAATVPSVVCDQTTLEGVVTIVLSGGTAPYSFTGSTGGVLTDSLFTSDPIPSGTAYSFTFSDDSDCADLDVTGTINCNCSTQAASLPTAVVELCPGDTLFAPTLVGGTFDADDIFVYVLHTGDPLSATDRLLVSADENLGIPPAVPAGTTLYISVLIGNPDGTGGIDFSDPCLAVSNRITVTVSEPTTLSVTATPQLCESGTATLNLEFSGGNAPFTLDYLQNGNPQTASNLAVSDGIDLQLTETTSFDFGTITDANGCVSSVNETAITTVDTAINLTVIDTLTVCNSNSNGNTTTANLTLLITDGPTDGTWAAVGNSGAMGSLPNLDFDGVTPGIYEFSYTLTPVNSVCPASTVSVWVVVENCACPQITLTTDALCLPQNGQTIVLADLITSGTAAGNWQIGQVPAGATPSIANGNFVVNGNNPAGDYELIYVLAPAPPAGCPVQFSTIINLETPPMAGIGTDLEFCILTDTLVELSTLLIGADQGGSWQETSAVPSTNAFDAVAATFDVIGQATGEYSFEYAVSGTVCPPSASEIGITLNALPEAVASVVGALSCDDLSVELDASGSSSSNDYSVFWSTLDGSSFPGDPTSEMPSISNPGTYQLLVEDVVTGCQNTATVTVDPSGDTPQAAVTISPIQCFGEQNGIIEIDSIAGGQPPYQVSFNDGAFGDDREWTGLTAGNYEIQVMDAAGCSQVLTVNVSEGLNVSVAISVLGEGDQSITLGDSIQLFAQSNPSFADLDSVLWLPAELLSCDTCQNPMAYPLQTSTFSISISENGCRASDSLTVFVNKDINIFAPTAFSPNGDGINDIFQLYPGPGIDKINEFQIFSRWGELVFTASQIELANGNMGWNGEFRGEVMNPAVFVWYAEIELSDGTTQLIEGDVTLIR